MKKHTRLYMDFFDYGETCFVMCELCENDRAVDIHHLEGRKMGAGKNSQLNYIENLMVLSRDCHNNCENDRMLNLYAKIKHLELVCTRIYAKIEYEKRYENRKNTNK